MPETCGTGVLVEDTGETARTLQHWSDLGILEPLPGTHKQGRGVQREFPADLPHGERTWALIASALNKRRIALGEIKLIISNLRKMSRDAEAANKKTEFNAAMEGKLTFLLVSFPEEGGVTWREVIWEDYIA